MKASGKKEQRVFRKKEKSEAEIHFEYLEQNWDTLREKRNKNSLEHQIKHTEETVQQIEELFGPGEFEFRECDREYI